MSAAGKREWAGAATSGEESAKRQRPTATPVESVAAVGSRSRGFDILNPATPRDAEDPATPSAPDATTSPHPMDALAAVRAQLLVATDPHLQAELLLRYSEAAISPGALTDAAIDFLFAFLQENQSQNASAAGGDGKAEGGASGKGSGDAGSSGAIVVGAIVRGLRKLLAVKAAVVQPMIQVDAMGEQLMQCVSVSEDFKLRRDMLQIVLDCLLLARKLDQVAALLDTCISDHDTGMQAICLRGFLRLHDASHQVVAPSATGAHFDRLATFLLHGHDESVKVLAARALTAVAESRPQLEIQSRFFPSVEGASAPLLLQQKAIFMLCMAASDESDAVRLEVALSLRGFVVPANWSVVEHAVLKTPIDEDVTTWSQEEGELKTVRMMSSGALLSLLEDVDVTVAKEASRTIARMASGAKKQCPWSEAVLQRAITAHTDVLLRSHCDQELWAVLIGSVRQLIDCRRANFPGQDVTLSSEQLNSLLRWPSGLVDVKLLVSVLSVLSSCDLSSASTVRRTIDFALDTATRVVEKQQQQQWDHVSEGSLPRDLRDVLEAIGGKCAPVLRMHASLTGRLNDELSRHSGRRTRKKICRVLLRQSPDSALNAAAPTTLPFLNNSAASEFDRTNDNSAAILSNPSSENTVDHLKAIQRLRSLFGSDKLPSCYCIAETLVRLKELARSYPKTLVASEPAGAAPVFHAVMPEPSIVGQTGDRCRELVKDARSAIVKQYALSTPCRVELLQILLVGRLGVALQTIYGTGASNSRAAEVETILARVKEETAQIEGHLTDQSPDVWLQLESLKGVSSATDLLREFVQALNAAWPTSWLELAVKQPNEAAGAMANGCISETNLNLKEPLEITANWPFKQRVEGSFEHVRDVSQIFVKSVLPDGTTQYHRIPLASIHMRSPRCYSFDHTISLVVPPFSDPTSFAISISISHENLPGASEKIAGTTSPAPDYSDIAPPVMVPIFHRTTSSWRHAPRNL